MTARNPNCVIATPIQWPRASAEELEKFDPATKACTMNCGPHRDDPRSESERKYQCGDCLTKEQK